jgi:NADPH-dependent 2,4-dienoyl-CoA reductase/sulfur reductase-like enzyme
MKFLIIGGDAAGMSAASRARRLDPSIFVTVLEQTRDVSYSACNMPYNLADPRRSMDDLVVRSADTFRDRQGIDLRLGHRAVHINPGEHTVDVRTDRSQMLTLPYDRLMIATGASPIMPDLPGFDLPGVMALKQLKDGRAIKARLQENTIRHTVIIGMGYIALEMCEALHARGIQVAMVKPRPELLPWPPRSGKSWKPTASSCTWKKRSNGSRAMESGCGSLGRNWTSPPTWCWWPWACAPTATWPPPPASSSGRQTPSP